MTEEHVSLTSSEMASLWDTFITNSHSICVLNYFVTKAEDQEIAVFLADTLSELKNMHDRTRQIIQNETIPVPKGFTDQDVDVNAPRLFSDPFMLRYIKNLSRVMTTACNLMFTMATRPDIREHFATCHETGKTIFNRVSDLLLAKGLYTRPPMIHPASKVDFVESKDYTDGKSLFHQPRPLNAVEISHLFGNIEANVIGMSLTKGYGQVADLKKVRGFMDEAHQLSEKMVKGLVTFLTESDLPAPMGSDTLVYSTTTAPFSDRLMMYEISILTAAGLSDYATSIATSLRKDLRTHYMDILTDTIKLAEKGEHLMFEESWMEQPPQQQPSS